MQPAAAADASSATSSGAEELVVRLLIAILVILASTRVVVWLVKRYAGQTDVAGEILAGLLLGPSALGAIAPEVVDWLFPASTAPIFVGIAQLGLVLLMFQIGLEFELGGRGISARALTALSGVGILAPFVSGFFVAPWFWSGLEGERPDLLAFRLFFGIAMSITAIPILGRIFMELKLSHTRTASLTIGAAAVDDVIGWVLLSLVVAIVTSSLDPVVVAIRVVALVGYVALVLFVVRPLFGRYVERTLERDGGLQPALVATVLIVLLASAIATSELHVFAIIGGFLIGVALQSKRRFVEEWNARVAPLVNTLLLPLFFAYTGLRTDVLALGSAEAALQCAFIFAIAFATKFGGSYVAARLLGESHRSAATIGVCMNTRALMELVVLNIGYDLGVLPQDVFSMFVVMAILTTFMATPLIRWFMRDAAPAAVEEGAASRAA